MDKNTNSKYLFSVCMSGSSLLISIIAICVAAWRSPDLGFDYQGLIVGVLSLLVTVLIGWQIYGSVSLEKKMDNKINDALESHSELIKERVYLNVSTIYASMYMEAYRHLDISGMILYNEMRVKPAIYSGDELIAKSVISNAKDIVSLVKKDTEKNFVEKIKEHSKRLKELCEKFPSLIDDYFDFQKEVDDFLSIH